MDLEKRAELAALFIWTMNGLLVGLLLGSLFLPAK